MRNETLSPLIPLAGLALLAGGAAWLTSRTKQRAADQKAEKQEKTAARELLSSSATAQEAATVSEEEAWERVLATLPPKDAEEVRRSLQEIREELGELEEAAEAAVVSAGVGVVGNDEEQGGKRQQRRKRRRRGPSPAGQKRKRRNVVRALLSPKKQGRRRGGAKLAKGGASPSGGKVPKGVARRRNRWARKKGFASWAAYMAAQRKKTIRKHGPLESGHDWTRTERKKRGKMVVLARKRKLAKPAKRKKITKKIKKLRKATGHKGAALAAEATA